MAGNRIGDPHDHNSTTGEGRIFVGRGVWDATGRDIKIYDTNGTLRVTLGNGNFMDLVMDEGVLSTLPITGWWLSATLRPCYERNCTGNQSLPSLEQPNYHSPRRRLRATAHSIGDEFLRYDSYNKL